MSNKRKHNLNKTYYEQYWIERLCNIACNVFKWEGLPKEINLIALEKQIMLGGYAIIFKDKQLDKYFALGGALSGVNVYGYPSLAKPVPKGFDEMGNAKSINTSITFPQLEIDKDCVVVWCNKLRSNGLPTIYEYASKLAIVDTAIKMNTQAMKHPIIAKTSEQAKASVETCLRQYDDDYFMIITDKTLSVEDMFDVVDFGINATEILNLQKQKENLLNEFYQIFGINSTVEKRERVVSGEINAMQQQTAINRSVWLDTRKQACEKLKEVFNLDVACTTIEFEDDSDLKTDEDNKDKASKNNMSKNNVSKNTDIIKGGNKDDK